MNWLINVQLAEGSFDSEHFFGCFGSSGSFLFIRLHLLAFHEPFTPTFNSLLPVGLTNPLSAVFLGQNVFTHFFVQGLEVVAVNFELSKKMKFE